MRLLVHVITRNTDSTGTGRLDRSRNDDDFPAQRPLLSSRTANFDKIFGVERGTCNQAIPAHLRGRLARVYTDEPADKCSAVGRYYQVIRTWSHRGNHAGGGAQKRGDWAGREGKSAPMNRNSCSSWSHDPTAGASLCTRPIPAHDRIACRYSRSGPGLSLSLSWLLLSSPSSSQEPYITVLTFAGSLLPAGVRLSILRRHGQVEIRRILGDSALFYLLGR